MVNIISNNRFFFKISSNTGKVAICMFYAIIISFMIFCFVIEDWTPFTFGGLLMVLYIDRNHRIAKSYLDIARQLKEKARPLDLSDLN